MHGAASAKFNGPAVATPAPLGNPRPPPPAPAMRKHRGQGFFGLMDEVRIWRVARSQKDILAHMRSTRGLENHQVMQGVIGLLLQRGHGRLLDHSRASQEDILAHMRSTLG